MTLACVSAKVGAITNISRTNVSIESPTFTFNEDKATFEDVRTNIDSIATPALWQYKVKTVRDDTTIYSKPSLGAKQVEWVALTASNWREYMEVAKTNHGECRTNKGSYVLRLFIFAARESTAQAVRIHRAIASRIQDAARSIDGYMLERGDVCVGRIARTYWKTTHARQPEGTEPSVPGNATFSQMQHLDSMRPEPPSATSELLRRAISVRLNGSSGLQLSFDVPELRAALGLSNYSLVVEGVFTALHPPEEQPRTWSLRNASLWESAWPIEWNR